MKCKYCHAELAPNARFCTSCGADMSKLNKCIRCGEFIEKGEATCPYCGMEQPQIFPSESGTKKGLWILFAILLLCAIGGVGYYFVNKKCGSDTNIVAPDTFEANAASEETEYDIHSVDGIKVRLNEIFTKALDMQEDEAVNKYFSQEFRQLYKKVEEIDDMLGELNEHGFWDGNIWDGGQDGLPNAFEIVGLSTSSSTLAFFEVNLSHNYKEYHSENKVSMSLVFENGNWFIDDNSKGRYKDQMKEYIEYWQKKRLIIDAYAKILNDYAKKGKDLSLGSLYFLYDITGDGISELWIQVEGDRDEELNYNLFVYEYKDRAASKIYQESVGHPGHHSFIEVNNCVCLSFSQMGSSYVEQYKYINGKIQTKVIYSKDSYDDDSNIEKPEGKELEIFDITEREHLVYLQCD